MSLKDLSVSIIAVESFRCCWSASLRVDGGDADLTAFAGAINGLEAIDLGSDPGANALTLGAADVIALSDTDTLTVAGDASDSVQAGTGWSYGGTDGGGNDIYTQGLATLIIDTDISVNADILI